MNASQVIAAVTAAFKGVVLGGGCSLRSAEEADCWGDPPVNTDQVILSEVNTTEDWMALSVRTLDYYSYLAHMDAEGFRYYIPAFMLSLLFPGDQSMRRICTLGALYPKKGELWDYHLSLYSLLSREQCTAIASFLRELPALVELDSDDQKICDRALRNYWHTFL